MSKRLGQALIILFVVGLMVSFSSLLFLVIFFNFSQIPPAWVIPSIAGCAGLQLVAFFGSVAFKQRVWPAALMLVCGVATAWVGVIGPATLFGMPATVLASPESVNPFLYTVTLPVTIVGVGVGIAYFVLGVICLVLDALAIQKQRAATAQAVPPSAQDAQDKQVIYSQVVKMLGVPPEQEPATAEPLAEDGPETHKDAAEAQGATETPTEASLEETAEAANTEEVANAEETPATAEPLAEDEPETHEDAAEALGATETPTEASLEETAGKPETSETAETASVAETDEPPADKAPATLPPTAEAEPAGDMTDAPPPSSAPAQPARRGILARIATYFRVEKPPSAEPAQALATEPAPQPAGNSDAASEPSPLSLSANESADSSITCAHSEANIAIDAPSRNDTLTLTTIPAPQYEAASPAKAEPEPDAELQLPPETDPNSRAASPAQTELEADNVPDAAPLPKPAEEPAFVGQPRNELLAQWGKLPIQPVAASDLGVTLETERLRIVRLHRAAFASLLAGVDEMEQVTGLSPSGEKLDAGTAEAFEALYHQATQDPANYKWYAVWLITSKSENQLMGSAGFKGLPGSNGQVELAYGIHAARRGNGYGPEAAVALCHWGMMQREVQSVLAETDPGDENANKLMAEAGLRPVQKEDGSHCWLMAE